MTKEEKEQLEKLQHKAAEEIAAAKKKTKKGLFSKFIIIGGFIYLFYFTERVLRVVESTGNEPGILIGAVFGAIIGECGLLAWIKNTKIKKG